MVGRNRKDHPEFEPKPREDLKKLRALFAPPAGRHPDQEGGPETPVDIGLTYDL